MGRSIHISYLYSGTFHFLLGAYYFDDVAGIQFGLCQYGYFNSRTLDTADADAMHEFVPADIRHCFSGERFLCDRDR